MDFYRRLNYSIGNEDWSVEEQALRLGSKDRALCVTASGDRPLHLLMTDCVEVISIDMNRIQNYLLDLKVTAISQLDYEKYLAFLGCKDTKHRYDIFNQIKPYLAKDTAIYWEQHKKMVTRGILYQGIVERLTTLSAKVFKLLRHKKIQALLSFTDVESQREFIKSKWDTILWKKTFDLFLNTNILKWVLNDPGLHSYVDSSIRPGEYIYQRMMRYLDNNLARKSALLQLILIGKILPDAYFPYMTYNGYRKIRSDIGRLSYQTNNIVEYLNTHPNEIDCFSMSDIASYMPQDAFVKLIKGIYTAAKPNARFCLREFMTKHSIPAEYVGKFQRDIDLEQKLEHEESNFVYRFIVGEVQK